MAKVKLTLNINNQSIKTLEELQANFEPFIILGLFRNGRLRQWAKSRGYFVEETELANLEIEQDTLDQDEIINRLIDTFNVQTCFKGVKSSQRHLARSSATINTRSFKMMNDQYASMVERLRRYGDPAEACKDLFNQANAGDPVAQFNLGRMYLYGEILEQDFGQAWAWLGKALRNNVDVAKTFIGKMFKEGLGVNKNYFKALELFKETAAKGDLQSQVELGLMYFTGEEQGSNYDEAFKWFNKAAFQGDPTAQGFLGLLYLRGHGVQKSEMQAFKWFESAAKQGNAVGQHNLGCMYLFGLEVHKNQDKAIELFKQAASQGYEESKRALLLLQGNTGGAYGTQNAILGAPAIMMPSTAINRGALAGGRPVLVRQPLPATQLTQAPRQPRQMVIPR